MSLKMVRWSAAVALALSAAGPPCTAVPSAAAPSHPPVVRLDARDPDAGAGVWRGSGTLGPFRRIGSPSIEMIAGVRAVYFDGKHDAYQGPASVPEIEGRHPRSIEVWVYKPQVRSQEETLVAWGRRGGPAGTNLALNYGTDASYGAATHWAEDMGWNGVPTARKWHQLVYTYDGSVARVYDNTALKNSLRVSLNTSSGSTVNIGVQNSARGALAFLNEFNGQPMSGPMYIAAVTLETEALSPREITRRFLADAGRFHAVRLRSAYDLIVGRGLQRLQAGSLVVTLSRATQEAVSLSPAGSDFDFLPYDRLELRANDGFYQLGDLEIRTREPGQLWKAFSTASHHVALRPLTRPGALAAADLGPALGPGCPLDVVRSWSAVEGGLGLTFTVHNSSRHPVEIGALGSPMVHNNILTGRSLDEAHRRCVFADPYPGGDAGYLQETRLNGDGPALLTLPQRGTRFEAYRPLHDDPTPRGVTFEGFYEWSVLSKAYAENEWKGADEWNRPTSRVLRPGGTAVYGFRFVLAPGATAIEATLIRHHRPVVIGIPGYVVPTDQPAELFLHTNSPAVAVSVEPRGALAVGRPRRLHDGWQSYPIRAVRTGRCRLTIAYDDGSRQYVHYFVTRPAAEVVKRFGKFSAERQWFTDAADPFQRTFSFLPYDDEHQRLLTQYDPSWMVGLSDEMGAGPNLAMAVKNLGQPDPAEVSLLEQYVDHALWGHLQLSDYGIRAGLFYYDPAAFPGYYTVRGGWDRARTETTWRSFNYPHQAAIYWCLYRLARDHRGLVSARPWQWYLRQAYLTALAMGTHAGPPPGGLQQFGQMVGDVYLEILRDLRREGWKQDADALESYERFRADHFRSLKYPFGSEMPWDSTGQEEVYALCHFFGYDDKAQATVKAVLAYDPTVPNWGYNGAARRYFDEAVNGTRWPDIVRLLHQYGGGMNAIPLLAYYRDHPENLQLLRVGFGGTMGALTDINREGFGAQCFDADPAIMKFDPLSGDFGIEFYGFATNTGAYAVRDPVFGWLGFGCAVVPLAKSGDNVVEVLPRDAFRNRIYVAPLGLYLTLDSGTFQSARVELRRRRVTVMLAPRTPDTPTALLRIEEASSMRGPRHFQPVGRAPVVRVPIVRGAYVIRLGARPAQVMIGPTPAAVKRAHLNGPAPDSTTLAKGRGSGNLERTMH